MFSDYKTYKEHLNYFETRDGKMAYFDGGRGKPILLVHGVPTSSWLYRKIMPLLMEGGYRVIAPDMLGYGSSDKPEGYEIYSDAHMGKRLLALMQHLNIENWAQVFHDGGGLWTWAMLKQGQSKVNSLFMLNTIVYQEGFNPPIKFDKGLIADIFTKLYSFSSLTQLISIRPTFKNGIKNKKVITKPMLNGYTTPLYGNGHHALYYFFTQTCKNIEDYSELHTSLIIPLTVIWGEFDDILTWKGNEQKVKENFKISNHEIHLLDAKHFIQEEQPDKIAEIILERLASLNI